MAMNIFFMPNKIFWLWLCKLCSWYTLLHGRNTRLQWIWAYAGVA